MLIKKGHGTSLFAVERRALIGSGIVVSLGREGRRGIACSDYSSLPMSYFCPPKSIVKGVKFIA